MSSDWEIEFPRLYRWRKPMTFFADLTVTGERRLRKFSYLATVVLMGFVIYNYFKTFYAVGGVSSDLFVGGSDWGRKVWSVYRGVLYMLTFIDFVLLVPACIVYARRHQWAKLTKTFLTSIALFMFITFSYAFAGLIIDLVFVAVGFHVGVMNSAGAGLPNDPVRLLLGK